MTAPEPSSVATVCSFCERSARWTVHGSRHAFRASACGVHTHQMLGMALLAGNDRSVVTPASNDRPRDGAS